LSTSGSRSLPALFLLILAGLAATYLALAEIGKAYFFGQERRAAAPISTAAA
jgi:hypothetical protein